MYRGVAILIIKLDIHFEDINKSCLLTGVCLCELVDSVQVNEHINEHYNEQSYINKIMFQI